MNLLKEYYEQTYAFKFDHLNEMDNFMNDKNYHSSLKEIGNMNSTISATDLKFLENSKPKLLHQLIVSNI